MQVFWQAGRAEPPQSGTNITVIWQRVRIVQLACTVRPPGTDESEADVHTAMPTVFETSDPTKPTDCEWNHPHTWATGVTNIQRGGWKE